LVERQVAIVEAHDASDGVDAGLLERCDEPRYILEIPMSLRFERLNLRVPSDAAFAVFEIEHGRVHAARAQQAHDAGRAEPPLNRRVEVESACALTLLRDAIDETRCAGELARNRPQRRLGRGAPGFGSARLRSKRSESASQSAEPEYSAEQGLGTHSKLLTN